MLGYNYGAGASDFCCHIVLLSDFRKVIFFIVIHFTMLVNYLIQYVQMGFILRHILRVE